MLGQAQVPGVTKSRAFYTEEKLADAGKRSSTVDLFFAKRVLCPPSGTEPRHGSPVHPSFFTEDRAMTRLRDLRLELPDFGDGSKRSS